MREGPDTVHFQTRDNGILRTTLTKCFNCNHNYNKSVKSDWLSTALISITYRLSGWMRPPWIGQTRIEKAIAGVDNNMP